MFSDISDSSYATCSAQAVGILSLNRAAEDGSLPQPGFDGFGRQKENRFKTTVLAALAHTSQFMFEHIIIYHIYIVLHCYILVSECNRHICWGSISHTRFYKKVEF